MTKDPKYVPNSGATSHVVSPAEADAADSRALENGVRTCGR